MGGLANPPPPPLPIDAIPIYEMYQSPRFPLPPVAAKKGTSRLKSLNRPQEEDFLLSEEEEAKCIDFFSRCLRIL